MYSVLCVDDEPDLLTITKEFLEDSQEFSVDTKESAKGALQALAERHYDAIVADFEMQGMNGIALLKEVRASFGDIPFIIFTGRGREEIVIQALNNGADFYLQKGGEPEALYAELMHMIRRAVMMRQAQMSLAEQEQRFHDIQNANDLIQSVAPDGHFLFVNKKWQETLGYRDEDLPGLTLFDIIHEESREHCRELFPRVLAGESVGIIDVIFKSRNGERVFLEGIATCKITGGRPQYTRGIFKNVTDRKVTESALRESEEKFRTLVEYALEGILILEGNGTILFANQAAGQLITMENYHELFGKRNVLEFLAPESQNEAARDFSQVAQGIDGYLARYKVIATTGHERWVECIGKRIRFEGAPAILISLRDITGRHAAETGLKESEEKLRALVEHSLDGILITDFTGRLLFANQAVGRIVDAAENRETIGTKNVLEFVAPESQADVLHDFSQVAQGIDAYLVYYKLITLTKREVWVECIGKQITFEGSPAILVSMRDVTERKRAEMILRESESKFATIFRGSPVAFTLVSALDGTFMDVNDAFVKRTGFTKADVIGRRSADLGIFPDAGDQARMASALHDRRFVYGMEFRCRIKTGEIRNCLFSSSLILMGGKPLILSSIEDITERKATEAALQAMVRSMVGTTGLDSLKKITDNVSAWLKADCVMIGEIQPDKNTVNVLSMLLDEKEIHDFSYTLRGTPCENVAEKGFCLYPDNATQLFPESRDLAELNIRGYVGTPLRDSLGQVSGILCVLSRRPLKPSQTLQEIMDIIAVKAAAEIERIRMERTLRESEEKFRTLVENSLDGILITDFTGRLLFSNRAASDIVDVKMTSDLPTMKNVIEFVAPESRAQALHDFSQVAHDVDNYPVTYQVITATGRKIWVEGIGKRILFRNSPAILVSMREVTDRKRAEEALRQANKKLNLLSTITRHDVLNKISVIQAHLALARKRGSRQDYTPVLEKIQSTTNIIKSQVEFTRIYQFLGTKEPEWQRPGQLISSTHIPDPVVLRNEVGDLEIYADLMLDRVFPNLVENSLRHGGHVTEIRLHTRNGTDGLTLFFEDNGIGIPAEEKEMIFERGYGKNTGLGLFLAREILDITGITIRETGEPGRGARFEITVPRGVYRTPAGQ